MTAVPAGKVLPGFGRRNRIRHREPDNIFSDAEEENMPKTIEEILQQDTNADYRKLADSFARTASRFTGDFRGAVGELSIAADEMADLPTESKESAKRQIVHKALLVYTDVQNILSDPIPQEEAQAARERERQEKLQQGMPEHLRSVRDDGFELLEQNPPEQRQKNEALLRSYDRWKEYPGDTGRTPMEALKGQLGEAAGAAVHTDGEVISAVGTLRGHTKALENGWPSEERSILGAIGSIDEQIRNAVRSQTKRKEREGQPQQSQPYGRSPGPA